MADSAKLFFDIARVMFEDGYTTPEKIADNIDGFLVGITAMTSFDTATLVRFMAHFGLYCKVIKNLGTEKHKQKLIDGCALRDVGCFAMTELGHGSNVRGLETTATYCPKTDSFVLHTPHELAQKFWIGNLGKTAFMAAVYAQLIVNGENHGVHVFLVQIRDKRDHRPFPGIEIGDCGQKMGLNGMDNGWMKFNEFRVPRDALLDRFGSVSKEGVYSSPFKNPAKRFAMSVSCLSGGRVIISRIA